MHGFRQLLAGIAAILMFPVSAWCAAPWPGVSDAAHEAMLGCRWRRCVTVIRLMPRADQPVRLQLNLDKGPPFFVETNTDTQQVMMVMGQEVKQTQTQVFFLEWTPLGKNQDGDAVLRLKIIGVKMKIDIGGVSIDYCSWDAVPSVSPLTEFFKKLLDAELKLTIDLKELSVKTVDGHEELITKIGASHPQMEPLLKSILSQDALSHMAAPIFGFLPKTSVRRGDWWSQQSALDLGPVGTYRSETKYTYNGKVGLHDRILAQTSLKYEAPKAKADLPYTIKRANLKSTGGKGKILFDAARGRLVSSEMHLKLEGSLTIDIGGMEAQVMLSQTQTQRIRVTDTNPLPPRKQ